MAESTRGRRRPANTTLDSEGVQGERLEVLKRRWAGLLATFTKREHELRDLIVREAAAEELEAKSEELKVCLSNLWSVHNLYANLLCEEKDPSELARVEGSYDDVEMRFRDVIGLIQRFIEGARKAEGNGGSAPRDSIRPGDSVSQTGSGTSSARIGASAKKAALIARSQMLEQQHGLKLKQIQLDQAQESLALKTQILEAQADESVYRQYEEGIEGDPVLSPASVPGTQGNMPPLLNGEGQEGPLEHEKAAERPQLGQHDIIQGISDQPLSPSDLEFRFLLLQQQMINALQLPKTELLTFDGNPLEYWMFTRWFDNCIGTSKLSDSVKLTMLLQHCKGDALKTIRCSHAPTWGLCKGSENAEGEIWWWLQGLRAMDH